jgi:hypothetical protein
VGRKRFFLFSVLIAVTNSALRIGCLKTTTAPEWSLPARKNRKTPWRFRNPVRMSTGLLMERLAEPQGEFILALKSLST